VNGVPYDNIRPSMGLHQGDPLSPYLFLLVAEGLSTLLVRAEREGKITGVPFSGGGLRLSHFFLPTTVSFSVGSTSLDGAVCWGS